MKNWQVVLILSLISLNAFADYDAGISDPYYDAGIGIVAPKDKAKSIHFTINNRCGDKVVRLQVLGYDMIKSGCDVYQFTCLNRKASQIKFITINQGGTAIIRAEGDPNKFVWHLYDINTTHELSGRTVEGVRGRSGNTLTMIPW